MGEFLAATDCDRLIAETFRGEPEGDIDRVLMAIARLMERGACGCERRDPAAGAERGRLGAALKQIEAVLRGAAAIDAAPLRAAKQDVVDLIAGERVVGDDGGVVD